MHPYLTFLGLKIPLYGVMTALGYVLAALYCRFRRKNAGLSSHEVLDVMFALAIGAVLGSKLFFIIFDWHNFRSMEFIESLRYGFVFYGGVIGVIIAALWQTRRLKMPFFKLADFIAPAAALGHAAGRIGCFLAGCCYGKIAHNHGFWTVVYDSEDSIVPPFLRGEPLYAVQLMEAAANLLLFFFLNALYVRKRKKNGIVAAVYILCYAAMRFLFEFLRGDDRGGFALGLSPSQFIALVFTALSGAFLLSSLKRNLREK
jgi:phosphatidylglycerol:prolipoprotein diacylglycerol transferase